MSESLLSEIQQTKPFASLREEVLLNIMRTGALLEHRVAEHLKPHGITATQYNVLRILRGAEPHGLGCEGVRSRMLNPVPDTTRLLDRLASAGLVARERDTGDRRVVVTRITKAGLDLLAGLDEPVQAMHERLVGHMSDRDLGRLVELLTQARRGL
jgi:DNA-binding MarR family transcriptional regulator